MPVKTLRNRAPQKIDTECSQRTKTILIFASFDLHLVTVIKVCKMPLYY